MPAELTAIDYKVDGVAEFPLRGRCAMVGRVDAADAELVASRRWYWNIARGIYCASERVMLTTLLWPKACGRVVFANGDKTDCRRRNLVEGCYSRSGIWFDSERGKYNVRVAKGKMRWRVRCESFEEAQAMRSQLAAMTMRELVCWRARQDEVVPEELSWLGDDIVPMIATRCAHDAALAARKGYEAGLMASRIVQTRNMEVFR
jgi:hypothetical protein